MNYFIYKQMPVLAPDRYTKADMAYVGLPVFELTFTAHGQAGWAQNLGYSGSSFDLDPRAELDAYYARPYGLTLDDLRYIPGPVDVMGTDYPIETFPVLKNSANRDFREYRTRRLVLGAWDRLESGDLH